MTDTSRSPLIVGPFTPEYRVTIDGYRVPHINARLLDDGRVDVTLDGRFGMPEPVDRDEFDRWIYIVANAMAIAAGYSCHGEYCTPLNKFKTRMTGLGSLLSQPPGLTVIDGGKPND